MNWKKLFYLNFLWFMLGLSFIASIYFAMEFAYMWHNIDLAYNVAMITNDLNQNDIVKLDYRDLVDAYDIKNSTTMSLTNAYIIGSNNLRRYFLFEIGAVSFFLISLLELFFRTGDRYRQNRKVF